MPLFILYHQLNNFAHGRVAQLGEHRVRTPKVAGSSPVPSTISDWEQGKKHPGFLNVLKYCTVLGITPDKLLGMETPKQLFSLDITEEERDALFSMLEACKHESDLSTLQGKILFLDQHLKALFSRAQSK